MKKLTMLLMAVMTTCAYGQGVFFNSNVTTSAKNVPPGAQAPLYTLPFAKVTVCGYPAVGTDVCTNITPIYSDQALTQVISQPLAADSEGRFQFWIDPSLHSYSIQTPAGKFVGTWPLSLNSQVGPQGPGGVGCGAANCIVSAPTVTQTVTQPVNTSTNFITSGTGTMQHNGNPIVDTVPLAAQTVTQPIISGAQSTLGVNSLQGILNVGLFAGASTSSKTLTAQTACGASTNGCYLIIPPGNATGDIPATSLMGADTVIDDQRYLNSAGPFFGFLQGTHAFHEYTQSVGPLQSWETDPAHPFSGPSMIALSANANSDTGLPSPTTQGELIPFMINVNRLSGSNRFIEGADINIGVQTLTNDANALELDCNNKAATDDTTPHIHCLQIIGGSLAGGHHPGTALQITALGDASSSWITAADISRYHNVGIGLDGGDTSIVADILIHPPDDSSTVNTIQQFNNARSQIVYSVKRNGDVTTGALQANGALNSNVSAAFNGSIGNGSAWQSFTGSMGCSTAATATATCTSTPIPLSVAFPNTNYTLVCTLSGAVTGLPVISSVSKNTTNFTITIAALTAVAATGSYNCTAIMHP